MSERLTSSLDKAERLLALGFTELAPGVFTKQVEGEFSFKHFINLSLNPQGDIECLEDLDDRFSIFKGIKIVDARTILPTYERSNSSAIVFLGENPEKKLKSAVYELLEDRGSGPIYKEDQNYGELEKISEQSPEDQLRDNGFELEREGEDGSKIFVFNNNSAEGENDSKIRAIIGSEGEIIKLLQPASAQVQQMMKGAKIVDFFTREIDDYGNRKFVQRLQLENSDAVFEIDNTSGVTSIKEAKYKKSPSFEELDIESVKSSLEPNSHFEIGGLNNVETIRNLQTLNGQPIRRLEDRMRPDNYSVDGFLDSNESLIERLIEDNNTVLSLGLTHQEIARPLKYAYKLCMQRHKYYEEFEYPDGGRYSIRIMGSKGTQESPFHDGTKSGNDMFITNLDSGKSFECGALLIDMIERYGFYEGKVPYRLDPLSVVETFFPAFESKIKESNVDNLRDAIANQLIRPTDDKK